MDKRVETGTPAGKPTASLRVRREDALLAETWGCSVAEAEERKVRAIADVVTLILIKRTLGLTAPLSLDPERGSLEAGGQAAVKRGIP